MKYCKICKKLNSYPLNSCCSSKCDRIYQKDKNKAKKAKRMESTSVLTKKADEICSKYIRTRDCLLSTGSKESGECVTCKKVYPFGKLQCGHFMSRSHRATRWEEKNMDVQCYGCNIGDKWRQYEHWLYINERYWEWTAESIYRASQSLQKVSPDFLHEIINIYSLKLSQLWTDPKNEQSEIVDPQYRLSL